MTEAAEADLAEIWAYLAIEASETTATRFVEAIEGDFNRLLDFPLSGPARDQLVPGLRAIIHSPFVIYYAPSEKAVTIVRVLHGARDVVAIAERGELGAPN